MRSVAHRGRGRNRRTEILLYVVVALAFFLVSAIVTHWAETGARHLTADRGGQVMLIPAAFLGVSAVFFVVKFVIYQTVIFTKAPDEDADVQFSRRGRVSRQRAEAAERAVL